MIRAGSGNIGLNRGVNITPITPERPRMTTITPMVPLGMTPIPLQWSYDLGHATIRLECFKWFKIVVAR